LRIGEREKSPRGSSGEWKGARQPLHGNGQQQFVGTLTARLTEAPGRVIPGEWADGIPEEMASLPQLRVRRRLYSFGQAVTFLVVVSGICIVARIFLAQYLRTLAAVKAFIAAHPGTGSFAPAVTTGFPWWLRAAHDTRESIVFDERRL
jgi:hypothetical protein